jgi:hypothetical protein
MQKRKAKITTAVLVLLSPFILSAQNSTTPEAKKPRVQEVGLALPNLKDFSQIGLIYRIGNEKAMWRFGTLSFKGSNDGYTIVEEREVVRDQLTINFSAGREFRKKVAKKFELRMGGDLIIGYSRGANASITYVYDEDTDELDYTRIIEDKRNTCTPALGFILGFNFYLTQNIRLRCRDNAYSSICLRQKRQSIPVQ